MPTIKISSATELRPATPAEGKVTFAEVHFGWETGNVIEVAANASQEDVISAYRAKFA